MVGLEGVEEELFLQYTDELLQEPQLLTSMVELVEIMDQRQSEQEMGESDRVS
jgi:hypothetical protein